MDLRNARHWTQDELAKRTGISKSFLSEIENGHTVPGGERLLRLAEALGTSTDYLLRGQAFAANDTGDVPVAIPPDLAELAAAKGWSFLATERLARAQKSFVARRSRAAQKPWARADWEHLYEAVKEYLDS